jgi:NAD(P)H-flavin reductase
LTQPAPFGTRTAVVSARADVGPYVALTAIDESGPAPVAGQFYMLRADQRWGGGEDGRPYLPRALSFARCAQDPAGLALDFFFERVGPGTRRLGELGSGEKLILTGPFGNGFTPDPERAVLLLAGGIGLAPILALADQLEGGDGDGAPPRVFVGMRSAAHAEALAHYGLAAELYTDDGSAGRRGFVTEPLAALLAEELATVYACGPDVMLEAVRAICAQAGSDAQLALESGMACGFGACHGCVVPTRDGYLRLCVDGPVVAAERLETVVHPGGAA